MVLELTKTISLLLSLSLLLAIIFRFIHRDSPLAKFLSGCLYGSIAILAMEMPFHFSPGVIFDPRSVIISLSGFFGGPISAIPAAIIAASYRFSLGGAGAYAGALVVVACAGSGICWNYIQNRYSFETKIWHFGFFGLLCHFVAMFGMLALPKDLIWNVVKGLSVPFFLVYPPTTLLLGAIIQSIYTFFDREEELELTKSQLEEQSASLKRKVDELSHAKEQIQEDEQALRRSYALLDAINEGTSDAIFVKDVMGRYLEVNTATLLAIGKPKEAVIGKTDAELFPQKSAQIISEVDSRVMQFGETHLSEERLETAYGETFYLVSKCPFRDENGQIIGLIGISRNITELKQKAEEKDKLEARLQQAQKMEAIGTLAGGIAHDFNNILGVIIGYTGMAIDDAPPDTKYQKDLEKVAIAANRAKDLVKQILAFSRQAQVDRIPIQIQPLIKEGLKMLRSSIPSTISITENISPKIGTVLADPTQINQILMNLCTNAYHAMEAHGGELSVALKSTFIGTNDQTTVLHLTPGEYVELTVSDTGVGIGPDVIEKIFDPYFTTKGVGKGTGMGLAIIHGIMKEYGGAITVDTQLGVGSTFHVYIPVTHMGVIPEIKESEDLPKGKERILFIDDEELLAEMGKDMLERLGYHVTVRRSGVEALVTFQNTPNKFDMVITDQTMPDMTGSDLARRMMQIRPDIPIILCTGYSNLIDEDSAKGLGIKEFALKPLTKGSISSLIRKVLDAK